MQIKEFLENVCQQIKYKPIRSEIADEIRNHIEETKEELISNGMEELKAEQEAVLQMGDAEEIGKKLNKIHKPKLDWKMLLNIVVLIVFGILVLFMKKNFGGGSNLNIFLKYGIAFSIGLVVSIFIYFMDYRKILKKSKYLYIVASSLMMIQYFFGTNINGKPYWIWIPLPFSITIISVIIPMYIIAFVGFLQNMNTDKKVTFSVFSKEITLSIDILKVIVLSGFSLWLFILMESINSSVAILGVSYLVIATVKLIEQKCRKKQIIMLWGIPALLAFLVVISNFYYFANRLIGSFLPKLESSGIGYIGSQQQKILNTSHLFGPADNMSMARGMFDEGTNYAFLSILAHFGWIPSLAMVGAVITLSVRLIKNAVKIKDMDGKLLIVGIASLFILQSVCNLLMNLNIGWKSDFNIPFVSYGNTGLIVNMMCFALVLSVYRRKDIIVQWEKQII